MSKATSGLLAVHFAQTISVRPRNSDLLLARMFGARAKAEANVRLIAAAWNACALINPENPRAAADAMPELAQAVELALIYLEDGAINTAAEKLRAAFAKIKSNLKKEAA